MKYFETSVRAVYLMLFLVGVLSTSLLMQPEPAAAEGNTALPSNHAAALPSNRAAALPVGHANGSNSTSASVVTSVSAAQASNPGLSPVSPVSPSEADAQAVFAHSPFTPPQMLVPDGLQFEDVELRPFLYWRAWANLRLPVSRVISFLMFALTIINVSVPQIVAAAGVEYKNRWLRSFAIGVMFFTLGLIAAGSMVRMGLYGPLGTLILAVVQLTSLVGLTISARSIGETTARLIRVDRLLKNPWLKGLSELWIGVLILAAISLIPGLGKLPRLGNRMLALLAAAGSGAFLLALTLKSKPVQSQQP